METELEALKLKDLKAKNLFQAIDRSILETILCKDTSKQIWNSMKKKYQGNARAKRAQLQTLQGEFETLRIKPGKLVSMYFSRDNCQQDRIHGERLEDVTIVEKIMRSMLPKFNFVICSIEESKDLDTLSLDELQNSLMVHEQKIVQQDVEEQALQVTTTSKDFGRRKSKWKGRNSEKTEEGNLKKNGQHDHDQRHSSNGKARFADKSDIECYRCHKYGHYRSKCRTNLKNVRGENSNFVEVTEEEEEVSLLMVSQSSEEYHTIKFGDDSCIAVKGKGKVKLQTKSSSMQIISDVFFTPDLKNNLITKITANKLFLIDMHNIGSTNFCFSTKLNSQAWLWHYRYGHLNFGGLKMLQQKKMVMGLLKFDIPVDICEDCVIGKQSRDSFPKGKAWRAKRQLELVH
ncbi:uncharacterized protein LOC125869606 [Solanum stenotomum]|uniref:uncharacterized protein LOC125869606 n=1 Tax=Solanum stenotomum TaxID=172797 RepID=UPI0020D04775|nr:uncharacterized protein LOC125869606 [Solanum stenotomum]